MRKEFSKIIKSVFGCSPERYPTIFLETPKSVNRGITDHHTISNISLRGGKSTLVLTCLEHVVTQKFSFLGYIHKKEGRGLNRSFRDDFVELNELGEVMLKNLPQDLIAEVKEEVSSVKKLEQLKKEEKSSKKSKPKKEKSEEDVKPEPEEEKVLEVLEGAE